MADKIQENRVRRAARRHRLELRKSPRRDPKAPDYDRFVLVDPYADDNVIFGSGTFEFSATLDQVEIFLGYRQSAPEPGTEAVPSETLQDMLEAWFSEKPARMAKLGFLEPQASGAAAEAILRSDLLGIVIPAKRLLTAMEPIVTDDPSEVGQRIVSILQTVAGR